METIFRFSLESTLVMGFLYILYWILLKNEANFNLNRFIILGSIVFSLVVPFSRFPVPFMESIFPSPVTRFELPAITLTATGSNQSTNSGFNFLYLIYFLPMALFFTRLLWNLEWKRK
ncbi:MAG: hypothetical protein ACLFUC_08615 [Bacteroidales bacterium]